MPCGRGAVLLATLIASILPVTAATGRGLRIPLEFEVNRGQFAPPVLFLARDGAHYVYLTHDGLTVGLGDGLHSESAIRMALVDADPQSIVAPEGELPGISNYFIGNHPSEWRRNVPHFDRVRYHAVWPGIDLVVHGRDQSLEYDFQVAPGADASAIRLRYFGNRGMELDATGNLVVRTSSGDVVQHRPEIYQERHGVRTMVAGRFRVTGDEVRLDVDAYDHRLALVIDPTVTYSTYIGASGGVSITAAAVDSSGNLYFGGQVSSPDYPLAGSVQQFSTSVGLFRSGNQGSTWGAASSSLGLAEVFALAIDPTASAVAYAGTSRGLYKTTNSGSSWTKSNTGMPNAAVLAIAVDPLSTKTLYACQASDLFKSTDGGASWKSAGLNEQCNGVAADPKKEGTIWVAPQYDYLLSSSDGGATYSSKYVRTNATAVAIDPTNSNIILFGALQRGLVRSTDGKNFTEITSGLTASTLLSVNVNAVAIDPRNPARVLVGTDTGVYLSYSEGSTFQSTSGLGTRKVLSLAYDPTSDSIVLAGTAGGGVYRSTDSGQTWTSVGPASLDVNAIAISPDEQTTYAGLYMGKEAFVTKLNAAGTQIVYSTFLGGSGSTQGWGLGVDSAGHAFLCGETSAADFPTQSAYQPKLGGGTDFFVTRLSASGSSLEASTFLGGHANDSCSALALDTSGNVYLAGDSTLVTTASSDFPTVNGFGKQSFGGQDCVVAKFDNGLQTLSYSTFLGGNNGDTCYGVAADASGNAYVVGQTLSGNFLVTEPPFGGSKAAGGVTIVQSFVAKIKPDGSDLIYSALLGGAKDDTSINAIVADNNGRAYVTGYSYASDYPVTSGVLNSTIPSGGNSKTVVTAIAADGKSLVYSTFLSGKGSDSGSSIGLDSNKTAWISGDEFSGLLPATADAFAVTPASDASTPFLAAIDSTGAKLLHATYLGGSEGGSSGPVVVASDGSIYVAGTTLSNDFTVSGTPLQKPQSPDVYAFLMHLVFSSSGDNGNTGPGTTPVITAVQNGASFQDGFPVNSWMTIKGTNLAAAGVSDTWDKSIINGQLPTTLDTVRVSVAGQPAYIYYVSPTQVNVIAPNVVAGTASVTVTNSLGTSAAFASSGSTYQPAFFQSGTHVVASHYPDYSYAGTAQPGGVLILWGTGFGPTNPAAPVGTVVPATGFPTAGTVTVTVGGVAATVYGSALASGMAGVYQVAIQVPPSLADGDYSIVATVGGVSSPASTKLTVQH